LINLQSRSQNEAVPILLNTRRHGKVQNVSSLFEYHSPILSYLPFSKVSPGGPFYPQITSFTELITWKLTYIIVRSPSRCPLFWSKVAAFLGFVWRNMRLPLSHIKRMIALRGILQHNKRLLKENQQFKK